MIEAANPGASPTCRTFRLSGTGAFAGFCYTQFADTYQEANGLLKADRTPKFPIEDIYAATTGGSKPVIVVSATNAPRQLPPEDEDEPTGLS